MLAPITDGLYAYAGNVGSSDKIAAFDLDGTLIRTVHGRFFKDENDWAFLPNRISTLKAYQDNNYTLVIFSNQKYHGAKVGSAINRKNNMLKGLLAEGLNPWVFVSTKDDVYRKPNIGMWDVFNQSYNERSNRVINKSSSFFVGDASGRPQDHATTDIVFAGNVGLPFYPPEEMFPNNQVTIPGTQTMFILVGMPGSGKTTYYQRNLAQKGYIHVNQDILKTQPKMLKAIETALSSGQSVAVDATNPNSEKRRKYIMLAVKYQVPTLIIYLVSDGLGWNKLRTNPVPTVAYNMYFKNLVEPTHEIDHVPVVQVF